METNKIAKKCYEEVFKTQKYEKSILHNTFGNIMNRIVQEAKKEEAKDIEKIIDDTEVNNVYERLLLDELKTKPKTTQTESNKAMDKEE